MESLAPGYASGYTPEGQRQEKFEAEAGAISYDSTMASFEAELAVQDSRRLRSLEADGMLSSPPDMTLACELDLCGTGLDDPEADGSHPFDDPSVLGMFTCHGLDTTPDGRAEVVKINQDCAFVARALGGDTDLAVFGVFDGHGRQGREVSLEALFALHEQLDSRASSLRAEPAKALCESFEAVDAHLGALAQHAETRARVDARESGCCALVALLRGRTVWVANAGDCRAVLGTRRAGELCAVPLSTEHKVDHPEEQRRLERAGAYVRPARGTPDSSDFLPARVYHTADAPRRGPGMCMSRAIGDLNARGCGVVPTPEITSHEICDEDAFLILASDGVWEFLDITKVVQLVDDLMTGREGARAIDACRMIITRAALLWRQCEGDYRDDITATIVLLPPLVEALERAAHAQELAAALDRAAIADER
jgi:protein phosphatase 2C family protein 2/3